LVGLIKERLWEVVINRRFDETQGLAA
jgi:hypothetical protein